ncbi:hypothetical protein PMG71_09880 [Roseofilum sp. BLCC_M154]|uniref:Uncharacterized protein n=1 Tax=Roseofilum acuticapitatum BLCC-M154 TaxID=3022444 RepID=A0ABT7AS55_9CYAN|nr:hypothetical protein [Roseofilum acuticapitatum]MDJ1169735.1 hypothetical protein [Roseofilum acuticapitatum BLCC-M154]
MKLSHLFLKSPIAAMPIIIMILILIAGYLGSELLALELISLLKSFSVPPWLLLTATLSLVVWCFGDER